MLRLSSSVCPFCEARSLARAFSLPWQQSRNAATLQKRRPSRMDLSPRVASGLQKVAPSGKPLRKSRNSPFGGMNVTAPPREFSKPRGQVSAAEQKRITRHVKGSKRDEKPKEPMKALKMQRALASVSYEARGRVKQELAMRDSFEEFDLLPAIKEAIPAQALGGLADITPTPIQRLAIPALLGTEDGKRRRKHKPGEVMSKKKEMQQFLLAAETGSGKTLAYVLPIVDAIKRAEAAEAEEAAEAAKTASSIPAVPNQSYALPSPDTSDPHPTTGRPRAIILVPTAELVTQVGALLKSLSHSVKFRAALLSANYSSTIIRNRLFSPSGIDLVVSTPHLLQSITTSDPAILSRVSHLVIDEADSLLDRSFSPLTSSLIDRATPSLHQLLLCSATIPRSLDTYLNTRYPSIRRLTTPNLHAIPRRVQLSVVDIDKIPYQSNRDLACAQVLLDLAKEGSESGERADVKSILVFVNEREKADALATYLRSKNIDASALSRDVSDRNSADALAAFTTAAPISPTTTSSAPSPPKPSPSAPATATYTPTHPSSYTPAPVATPAAQSFRPGLKVLVSTDLLSRGIDTSALRTVLLYDVPHTSIDFIHRLGRVGRMGRRGRGVVLVGKGDRKDVVREVREGMFRGVALI